MAAKCELVGNEGLNGALELLTGEVIVRIHDVLLLHATLGSPESVGRLLTMWNDLLGQSSSAISVAVGRMMRMRVEGGGVFLVVLGSGGDYVRLRLVILMNGRIGMGE